MHVKTHLRCNIRCYSKFLDENPLENRTSSLASFKNASKCPYIGTEIEYVEKEMNKIVHHKTHNGFLCILSTYEIKNFT